MNAPAMLTEERVLNECRLKAERDVLAGAVKNFLDAHDRGLFTDIGRTESAYVTRLRNALAQVRP
jgi:hypothetical protein